MLFVSLNPLQTSCTQLRSAAREQGPLGVEFILSWVLHVQESFWVQRRQIAPSMRAVAMNSAARQWQRHHRSNHLQKEKEKRRFLQHQKELDVMNTRACLSIPLTSSPSVSYSPPPDTPTHHWLRLRQHGDLPLQMERRPFTELLPAGRSALILHYHKVRENVMFSLSSQSSGPFELTRSDRKHQMCAFSSLFKQIKITFQTIFKWKMKQIHAKERRLECISLLNEDVSYPLLPLVHAVL